MPRGWSFAGPKSFLPPNPVYPHPGYEGDWLTKEFLNQRAEEVFRNIVGKVLGEPSLYQLSHDKSAHCYRLYWSRAFDHEITFRLNINPDKSGSLVVKILDESRKKLESTKTVSVSPNEVSEFLEKIQIMKFWTSTNEFEGLAMDGSVWFLEGVRDREYKIAIIRSPKDEALMAPGLYLLELSGRVYR